MKPYMCVPHSIELPWTVDHASALKCCTMDSSITTLLRINVGIPCINTPVSYVHYNV